MRWMFMLTLVAACATSREVRFTATYGNAGPSLIQRLVFEATAGQGYRVAHEQQRLHDYVFITVPVQIDRANPLEVAFLVQVVFEVEARQKKRFTVIVIPRAYENERELGEERLPPGAQARARALSDAIRTHARRYEAPAI